MALKVLVFGISLAMAEHFKCEISASVFLSPSGDAGPPQRGRHGAAQADQRAAGQNYLPEPLPVRSLLGNHNVQRVHAADAGAAVQLHRPPYGRALVLCQTQSSEL